MRLPLGFGRIDWSDWLRGLVAAFISGGATAVTGGIVASQNNPNYYSMGGFVKLVLPVFVVWGVFGMFFFLRTRSLPELKKVEKEIKTTEQPGKQPTTVTTITETSIEEKTNENHCVVIDGD